MQQSSAHPRSVVRLSEYRPPDWWSTRIDLIFELDPEHTVVTAVTKFERNTAGESDAPLILNGEHIDALRSVKIDGTELNATDYARTDTHLTILRPPADRFELEVVNVIAPAKNTALEGLYMSSGMYCTQCEAEGFRRITYSQDRPDVMSLYTTTIVADTRKFPVLLSNGNPVKRMELTEHGLYVNASNLGRSVSETVVPVRPRCRRSRRGERFVYDHVRAQRRAGSLRGPRERKPRGFRHAVFERCHGLGRTPFRPR